VETIKNIQSDPDWLEAVQDQVDWVDVPKALLSLGYHTVYVPGGELVNLSK
jgi:hypothetical protein